MLLVCNVILVKRIATYLAMLLARAIGAPFQLRYETQYTAPIPAFDDPADTLSILYTMLWSGYERAGSEYYFGYGTAKSYLAPASFCGILWSNVVFLTTSLLGK